MINFTLLLLITYIVNFVWHLGVIFLIFIFCCWIFQEENNIVEISVKKNKMFYVLWGIILSVNIVYSAQTSFYEIFYKYDMAKETALYIKNNNLDKQKIVGIGYRVSAIQPYFKNNIFVNRETTYDSWSKKELTKEEETIKELIDNSQVVVTDYSCFTELKDYFKSFSNGTAFDSYMFMRGSRFKEKSVYLVFYRQK
jgi:hypothetical protein